MEAQSRSSGSNLEIFYNDDVQSVFSLPIFYAFPTLLPRLFCALLLDYLAPPQVVVYLVDRICAFDGIA